MGFPKHEPIAMLLSGVVRDLPPSVDDWTFPDFDNAVARVKTGFGRRLNEVDVRPLKLVVMNIVGNFAKQNTIMP
ncbi:MAG: hypothetical protein IIA92_00025 [Chloroflexi bacterium]|nr:hypothetical protein [Chloroflexota bacterium]